MQYCVTPDNIIHTGIDSSVVSYSFEWPNLFRWLFQSQDKDQDNKIDIFIKVYVHHCWNSCAEKALIWGLFTKDELTHHQDWDRDYIWCIHSYMAWLQRRFNQTVIEVMTRMGNYIPYDGRDYWNDYLIIS